MMIDPAPLGQQVDVCDFFLFEGDGRHQPAGGQVGIALYCSTRRIHGSDCVFSFFKIPLLHRKSVSFVAILFAFDE